MGKLPGNPAVRTLQFHWLELCNSTAEGTVSIPGWGTNISQKMSGLAKKKQGYNGKFCSVYFTTVFFFFFFFFK